MKPLYRLILKHICKKLVVQGFDHQNNITEYYQIIREAARDEFTEDGDLSLNAFLHECFVAVVPSPQETKPVV